MYMLLAKSIFVCLMPIKYLYLFVLSNDIPQNVFYIVVVNKYYLLGPYTILWKVVT